MYTTQFKYKNRKIFNFKTLIKILGQNWYFSINDTKICVISLIFKHIGICNWKNFDIIL